MRIVSLLFVCSFFAFPSVFAAERHWSDIVREVEVRLNTGAVSYAEGRIDEAKASLSDAYFNAFEGEGMETAIRLHISSARAAELEAMFADIRKAVNAHASAADVKGKMDLLVKALTEDSKRLPEKNVVVTHEKGSPSRPSDSYPAVFFNSFIVILREGFEAILVISALTAYLAKAGHKDKIKTVYKGAGIAVIASILTAVLLQGVIKISGAGREALEGITMLFATAVLFYVSYWLITKIAVARWQHYIKSKVERSLARGSILTLGFAAFLSVYREGAETILFYQALYSTSGGNSSAIVIGFTAGSFILAALFLLIKYGSVRIPIGPFFAVTSALLYYLAFTFAGKGILELQNAEWISSTSLEGFPTIGLLGIYPTWEGMALQGVLVAALVAAMVYSFVLKPYQEKAVATKDIFHIESDIGNIHELLDDVSRHATICHGLAQGIAGTETGEMRKHLIDIDNKVHEVAEHLDKLSKGLEDVFSELERNLQKG